MVHNPSKSFDFFTTRLQNAVVKFSKTVVPDGPGLPSVQHLLKNRAQVMSQYQGKRATKYRTGASGGDTPSKSLLRLYTFFVVGWGSQGRQEVEYFWNQKDWSLSQIPDPQDPDNVRLGILVVLVRLLAKDFNGLLGGGLARGAPLPSPLRLPEKTEEKEDIPLETVPEWVEQFQRVTSSKNEWIHIPDAVGYPGVNDPGLSEEFKEAEDRGMIYNEEYHGYSEVSAEDVLSILIIELLSFLECFLECIEGALSAMSRIPVVTKIFPGDHPQQRIFALRQASCQHTTKTANQLKLSGSPRWGSFTRLSNCPLCGPKDPNSDDRLARV